MALLLKALFGAIIVIVIQLLARSKNFYIAGLVPLFPTFTLISNYIVGTERSPAELRQTVLFGMLSILPYFGYLLVLYLVLERLRLVPALLVATLAWFVCAIVLVLVWNRL
jgi:uncharacterized membrane protein (GlpM family)